MTVRKLAVSSITAARPMKRLTISSMLVTAVLVASVASADETDELVSLINDFRTSGQGCDGTKVEQVGPLAPVETLASIRPGERIEEALRESGYQAATLQIMAVTGPGDAGSVMRALKQRYCDALSSGEFAELGVAREGATWRVILAKPLLSADLGDWQQAGKAILQRINQARAAPRHCGDQPFEPAPPVRWDQQLGHAARAHSQDMAQQNYFSHRGHDQSEVGDRASRQGYRWQRIGENIAAGQGSAEQAVSGWLASPGHCKNIMNPDFTEMGAAYAIHPQSAATIYWTQVFGTPR